MALEPSVNYISDLDPTSPTGADPKSQGDNHLQNIKKALKQSFPNVTGVMPVAHDQVASKNDIAQAQFTTALPLQSGNGGKYLYTDGSSASWVTVPPPPDFLLIAQGVI